MSEMLNRKSAMESFGRLLDAIPKNKKTMIFDDACIVEGTMNEMCRVLSAMRKYYDDEHGEEKANELPFVKLINNLIPRPVKK